MARLHRLGMLAAALLTAAVMLTPAAAFSDTDGHWAAAAIEKWSEEYRIIQGYEDGTFRPDQSITRGAFAGIMDRFMKFQKIADSATFSDIAGTYWEWAVLKLNAAGVYLGNQGKALPGDTITRQQAVTMIARAFNVSGEFVDLPYTDADQIAEYARSPVSEMYARGYLENDSKGGAFRPTDPITRAEIVNIFNNMIDVLVQEPVTYTQDIEGSVMLNASEGGAFEQMTITGDLMIAPGVSGSVTLRDVTVQGEIRNYSDVEVSIVTMPQVPENQDPVGPGGDSVKPDPMDPYEVYTPSETTGDYIMYDGKQIPVYADRAQSPLQEGDFAWEDGRLVYVGDFYNRVEFGIDVSAYQNRASENGTIDWEAVADDGVDFAMVRIGFRGTAAAGTLNADAFYRENIEGAMAAGIETGVYFFAQAITVEEAIEEADFVIALLEECEIDGPVAYDWEMQDSSYRVYGTPPEMATACAVAFCQRIEEAGYTPMVYAGQYVSYLKYDMGALSDFLFWYPEYKSDNSEILMPQIYYEVDYWQFTSQCTVAGIGGRVDGNLRFRRR